MLTLSNKDQKDFQDFLGRLEMRKKERMGERFERLLSKESLNRIFDYLLENPEKDATSNPGEKLSESHIHDLNAIRSLKPGEAYRLSKEATRLARTLNILRNDRGEFQLIIETKSKLKEGNKQQLPPIGGAYKSGKSACRADRAEQELFNLTISIENYPDKGAAFFQEGEEYVKRQAEKEVAASRLFNSPEVNEITSGPLFFKDRKSKISVYSVKARGTLADLLKEEKLTVLQTDELIIQLLKGVKRIHEKGYVHQDLKVDNILIYDDLEEGYRLKITDFGSFEKQRTSTLAEIQALFYDDLESAYFPHPAYDMFEVGLIIFEMRYDRKFDMEKGPLLVAKDPLLQGLFEPEKEKRISAERALTIALSQKEKHSQMDLENKRLGIKKEEKEAESMSTKRLSSFNRHIKRLQEQYERQKTTPLGKTLFEKDKDSDHPLRWLQEVITFLSQKDAPESEKAIALYSALYYVSKKIQKGFHVFYSDMLHAVQKEQKELIEDWPELKKNSAQVWDEKAKSLLKAIQKGTSPSIEAMIEEDKVSFVKAKL